MQQAQGPEPDGGAGVLQELRAGSGQSGGRRAGAGHVVPLVTVAGAGRPGGGRVLSLTGARGLSPPRLHSWGTQGQAAGTGRAGPRCKGAEVRAKLQPPGQVHVHWTGGAGPPGCESESEQCGRREAAPHAHRCPMVAMSPSPGPENRVHVPGSWRSRRSVPRHCLGAGGAEGLSVAHPGGHFFLLGTRGRQVSSRGAADVRTCGRVAAVSRGPSLWATPDGAGSRQLQPGKPRRPPEGPDRDGVCGTRPAGADRSRRGGRTAGCAGKAAFTKLVSWPPLHTLNQTPRETSGRQPGHKDDHPQGDLRPGAPSLRSLSAQVADERTGQGVAPGSPVQLAGLAPIRLVRSTLGEVMTSLTCPPGSTEDAGP